MVQVMSRNARGPKTQTPDEKTGSASARISPSCQSLCHGIGSSCGNLGVADQGGSPEIRASGREPLLVLVGPGPEPQEGVVRASKQVLAGIGLREMLPLLACGRIKRTVQR